jgi:hypothetical protein
VFARQLLHWHTAFGLLQETMICSLLNRFFTSILLPAAGL